MTTSTGIEVTHTICCCNRQNSLGFCWWYLFKSLD